MTPELASSVIALIGTGLILFWFIVISGVYRFRSDPFFARGELEAAQIRANLGATATSLAGALFFFMNSTAAFGWVMLTVPVFNICGILLFVYLVRRFEINPDDTGSIFRILFHIFESHGLAKVANLIVVLNFVSIFIIEVLIGSTIFNYFFDHRLALLAIALLISMVAFAYVMRGGFDAVTQTDRWQLWLVIGGFTLAFLTIILASPVGVITRDAVESIFRNPQLPEELQYAFLANAFFINLFLPATQISTWERYSSGTRREAIRGFLQGALLVLLPVWFLAIGTAALTIVVTGGQSASFFVLFDLIKSFGPAAAVIVFPVLFMGLVAALLSTADSFMISSMLAVSDFSKFKKNPGTGEIDNIDLSVQVNKSIMWKTGLSLIAIALAITAWVSYSPDINKTVTQLLFAAYGMPCLLFPLIAYGCLRRQQTKLHIASVVFGLLLGLCALWAGAVYGIVSGSFYGTLLGPLLGITFAGCGVVVGLYRSEAE